MTTYRALYFHLFRVLGEAVDALERGASAEAKARLIAAQREAEERCLEQDILPDR